MIGIIRIDPYGVIIHMAVIVTDAVPGLTPVFSYIGTGFCGVNFIHILRIAVNFVIILP